MSTSEEGIAKISWSLHSVFNWINMFHVVLLMLLVDNDDRSQGCFRDFFFIRTFGRSFLESSTVTHTAHKFFNPLTRTSSTNCTTGSPYVSVSVYERRKRWESTDLQSIRRLLFLYMYRHIHTHTHTNKRSPKGHDSGQPHAEFMRSRLLLCLWGAIKKL